MSSPVDEALDRLASPGDREGFVDWEAHATDIATLRSELERLREERDELAEDVSAERDAKEAGRHLREAAEEEIERLRGIAGLPGVPPYRIAGIPPGIISADDYDVTDEALAFLDRIGKEEA